MGVVVISIRRSVAHEGLRALEIWRAAVDATHDFLTPEDRVAIDKEVESFLPGAALLLSVTEANYPICLMIISRGQMDALFIDPHYRGIGAGRALVEHGLKLHSTMTTDVNEQNEQAVGFYRRMGFVPTGRREWDDQGRFYPIIHLHFGAD